MSCDSELYDLLQEAIGRGSFSVKYEGFEPYLCFTAEIDGNAVTSRAKMSKIVGDLEKDNAAYWEKRADRDARFKAFFEKEEKRYQRACRALDRKVKRERRAAAKAARLALSQPPHSDHHEASYKQG